MVLRCLLLTLLLFCGTTRADERISICFNYSCVAEAPARFSESQLAQAKRMLQAARSPVLERKVLAQVVGNLYRIAGRQTPVYADRGGNLADEAVNGAMDCIDHSTTTTRFLKMLAQRGWLRHHRVLEPARRTRGFIFEHYSAMVEELPPRWLPKQKRGQRTEAPGVALPGRFVVDSWFVNNGEAAVILPLDEWLSGGGPDVGN